MGKFKIRDVVAFIIKKPGKAIRYARFMLQNFLLILYVRLRNYVSSQEKGLVSVITPTCRRLDKLKEAIDSVRRQSYEKWEHIIVSDGYDSEVKEYIKHLEDKRIKYFSTFGINIWGNYQRNYALIHASGEYVLYLDDDNVIFKDALKHMIEGFTSDDIDYVIAPIQYGERVMKPTFDFKHGDIDLLNYMLRRKTVIKIGGQNVHNSADFFLISEVRKISKGNIIDKIIGHHR